MNQISKRPARGVRLRTAMACPVVSVPLVVSIALAMTTFSPSQAMALVAPPALLEATAPVAGPTTANPTPTAVPDPTAIPSRSATPSRTTDAAPPNQAPQPSVVVPTATLAPTGRTTALYPLQSPTPAVTATTSPTAAPAVSAQPNVVASTSAVSLAAPVITSPNIHGPYSATVDQCATCHRTHTANAANGLTRSSPQSTLCFTCHDGTGANTDVKATYTDPAVPQNDVPDRLIYRHDTLQASNHTSTNLNEFGGVSNRHTECSDCHNAHRATGTDSTATTTGFTNSGRLKGVSGVSVVNGATTTAPVYTFLDGKADATSITREYQLCFKCHSGFTKLDSNAGFLPSRYRLDKGIEFNPANPSYHPVEAPGKNISPKMLASLTGPSPYRQWTLSTSSVISCANCHSNYKRFNLVTPPSANASSPLHASNTGGILRQNYRNRLLKPVSEGYKDSDFALCLMCHSNTPFANQTGTGTNFGFHGYHLTALIGQGSGIQTIDTPGAGGGNAICAECHFRQHSTTFKNAAPPQTTDGTHLVSFGPNVQANNGTLAWTTNGAGTGSCTLTCHGKTHDAANENYSPGSP